MIVKNPIAKLKLTTEYFEAARLNFEAVKAAAHELCDRGFSAHPVDGKAPRSPGWPDAPRKTHEDIEHEFRPRFLDAFIAYPNLGFRIDMDPAGDAPNCVTDVDIRTDDPAAIEQCMAAARRHMGDRQPDAITGRGGLHFYDQLPRARIDRIFGTASAGGLGISVFKLDWSGAAEGAPPPLDGTGWTIEMLAPRHNVLAPPSVHPVTLKPYRAWR